MGTTKPQNNLFGWGRFKAQASHKLPWVTSYLEQSELLCLRKTMSAFLTTEVCYHSGFGGREGWLSEKVSP